VLECLTFRGMGDFSLMAAPAAVCAGVLKRALFLTTNRRLEHTNEVEFPMQITATQIAKWAGTKEAQGSLRRLVRKVVHAAGTPTQVAFPAGDSTSLPGWDGELASEYNSPWVPKGKSFWEFSCAAPLRNQQLIESRTDIAFGTGHRRELRRTSMPRPECWKLGSGGACRCHYLQIEWTIFP
jgi:hypothetical protein